MTGQRSDELRGGPEREPVRFRLPRWLVVAAVVVAVGVAAVLASRADQAPPAAAPPSSPTAVAPATMPTAASTGPSLAGPLSVGAICTHTDGATSLQVQFQIANGGLGRVTVLAVRPVLPIGGLRPGRVTLPRSPSCGTPAARTGGSTVLEPGQRVGVQLAFGLPRRCPAPYPVQVDVDVLVAGENPGTQRVILLADLGGVHFRTCPTS